MEWEVKNRDCGGDPAGGVVRLATLTLGGHLCLGQAVAESQLAQPSAFF